MTFHWQSVSFIRLATRATAQCPCTDFWGRRRWRGRGNEAIIDVADTIIKPQHQLGQCQNYRSRDGKLRTTRWLKEAIWIKRKGDQILKRDEGPTDCIPSMIASLPRPRHLRRPQKSTKGHWAVVRVASLMKLTGGQWNVTNSDSYFIIYWISTKWNFLLHGIQ